MKRIIRLLCIGIAVLSINGCQKEQAEGDPGTVAATSVSGEVTGGGNDSEGTLEFSEAEIERIKTECIKYDSSYAGVPEVTRWEVYYQSFDSTQEKLTGTFYFISKDGKMIRKCQLVTDGGRGETFTFRWNPSESKVAIGYTGEAPVCDTYCIFNLEEEENPARYTIFDEKRFAGEAGKKTDSLSWHEELPAGWEDEDRLRIELRFTGSDDREYTGRYWYDCRLKTYTDLKLWPADGEYGFSESQMKEDLAGVRREELSENRFYNGDCWRRDGALFGLLARDQESDLSVYGYGQPKQYSGLKGIVIRWGEKLWAYDWEHDGSDGSVGWIDADGDGEEELALILETGSGSGVKIDDLYIGEFQEDKGFTWSKLGVSECEEMLRKDLKIDYDKNTKTVSTYYQQEKIGEERDPDLPDEEVNWAKTERYGLGSVWRFEREEGSLNLIISPSLIFDDYGRLWLDSMTFHVIMKDGHFKLAHSETERYPSAGGESENTSDIISWFTADIDGDLKEELLLIRRKEGAGQEPVGKDEDGMTLETGEKYGTHLEVYSDFQISDGKPVLSGEPEYSKDFSDIKPFRVQAGDIDGDGRTEISVCVYKTAKFHPVPAKRPFFYRLDLGNLEPVWLGSRLARPFEDFVLCDIDQDSIDEIISIEKSEDGRSVVAVYDWRGFGFEEKAVSEELEGKVLFSDSRSEKLKSVHVTVEGREYEIEADGGRVELGGKEKSEK